MKLLLTNDDGIFGEGITTLATVLSAEHDITVVAPSENRSATGHLVNFWKPVSVKETVVAGCKAYALGGSPCDCVKFAHDMLTDVHFDAVISGINCGTNLGTDTMYSGTLAAAFEARYLGYKAIALSSCADVGNYFDLQAKIAKKLIPQLLADEGDNYVWNVNFPNVEYGKLKGVRVTPLGKHVYADHYTLTEDGYVLGGECIPYDNPEDCDVKWIEKGYITATPLLCNRSDTQTVSKLNAKKYEF